MGSQWWWCPDSSVSPSTPHVTPCRNQKVGSTYGDCWTGKSLTSSETPAEASCWTPSMKASSSLWAKASHGGRWPRWSSSRKSCSRKPKVQGRQGRSQWGLGRIHSPTGPPESLEPLAFFPWDLASSYGPNRALSRLSGKWNKQQVLAESCSWSPWWELLYHAKLFAKQPGVFVFSASHSHFGMNYIGFPWRLNGKESSCQCKRHERHWFHPWVGKTPGEGSFKPVQYSCLGKSHGQRSLVGCKESVTT